MCAEYPRWIIPPGIFPQKPNFRKIMTLGLVKELIPKKVPRGSRARGSTRTFLVYFDEQSSDF